MVCNGAGGSALGWGGGGVGGGGGSVHQRTLAHVCADCIANIQAGTLCSQGQNKGRTHTWSHGPLGLKGRELLGIWLAHGWIQGRLTVSPTHVEVNAPGATHTGHGFYTGMDAGMWSSGVGGGGGGWDAQISPLLLCDCGWRRQPARGPGHWGRGCLPRGRGCLLTLAAAGLRGQKPGDGGGWRPSTASGRPLLGHSLGPAVRANTQGPHGSMGHTGG
jgi:hypothetical protein